MTPPRTSFATGSALFLTPEEPKIGFGGGGLRSASLLAYLQNKYTVQPVTFSLRPHSRSVAARVWRNTIRLAQGRPPLFDRYSGYEHQLSAAIRGRYAVGVVEHFWCASYAPVLRTCCDRLVLDLHNIESQLARTHARAARWPASWASERFAESYQRLERRWLSQYDVILAASEDDRRRIWHRDVNPDIRVFPNALPEIPRPHVAEADAIVFSGNLEYHPNVEAVRWFRARIWPRVRERAPAIEWRLLGSNPAAVAQFTGGDTRIRVVGPVNDAVEHLAEAKVCLAPLLSGSGTRFKILEAWAAGRAVVSTTLGAEGLDARAGEHLLLADNPDDFADAVLRLWNDPALRAQLGDAGRALYEERFTWPAAWRKLEEAGGI
ncbi:MAG: glycosyl transferase, group 1 [Bryobacterales bacterium]|nr:glycosyl transferase, group 1 [Bryobacterales bacterium]